MVFIPRHNFSHNCGSRIKYSVFNHWRGFFSAVLFSTVYALNAQATPFKDIDFDIALKGNTALLKLLEKELTHQRKNNSQLNLLTLHRKIVRMESQLLTERLHAEGYYDARIQADLRDDRILYRIEPGGRYRVKAVFLQLPKTVEVPAKVIEISAGAALRAEEVLAARKALQRYVAANFCLFEINVNYRVLLDSRQHLAAVTFTVEDSPSVRFGDISFVGLRSIDAAYLRARIPAKEGECFKRALIDTARLALIQTNLLISVNAEIATPIEGAVPITLTFSERQHRTLSVGAGFQTDEGLGLTLGWTHRNLKRRAQRLQVNAKIAENLQKLSTDFAIPHFRRDQQALTLYSNVSREETDAFESKIVEVGGQVARKLKPSLRGIVGAEWSFSNVLEEGEKADFALLSLPLSLEYDKRNDPLDPRSGWVAAGRLRPFWDAYNSGTRFLKSTLATSAYFTASKGYWQPTLALRAATGTINGASREEIPAHVRFYVGGGGSVRAYPYQTLGPLTDGDPDGGLSFTEVSIETRLRWGENWGGVVFVDGGLAYEQTSPQIDEDLLWSVGLGLRYYTSFAPIRVDLAFPLDKRKGIDDSFQLYISIGQAF